MSVRAYYNDAKGHALSALIEEQELNDSDRQVYIPCKRAKGKAKVRIGEGNGREGIKEDTQKEEIVTLRFETIQSTQYCFYGSFIRIGINTNSIQFMLSTIFRFGYRQSLQHLIQSFLRVDGMQL